MRLEDCETEGVDRVVSAPFERSSTEADWVEAGARGILPPSLMRLYERARFLTFDGAPKFLADEKHQLFSYFALMLRGVKEGLADSHEELALFKKDEALIYDLGKASRGEAWDGQAPARSRKHFRFVLLSVFSSLDCIAELTALLLYKAVPGLELGKAAFQSVEEWLKKTPLQVNVIWSPQKHKAYQLHDALKPLICCDDEEKDWLPLARLFRNKAAHLGTEHFREFGFEGKDGVFYTFVPKKWPLLWEEHITRRSEFQHDSRSSLDFVLSSLMKQDKISYLCGLVAKVYAVVEAALSVLDAAYHEFSNFSLQPEQVTELAKATKEFAFQAFHTDKMMG